MGHQVNIGCEKKAKLNRTLKQRKVSKVRPEAWWSYYSQGYKGPNGLSLQRYPKNYGKQVKDNTD